MKDTSSGRRLIRGNGEGFPAAITQTTDGGYVVVGSTNSSGPTFAILVLKLDAGGNIQWQKRYGWRNDSFATSVEQTADGGYIIAGNIITSTYDHSIWVLKLNYKGDIEWQRSFGSGATDVCAVRCSSEWGYIIGATSSCDLLVVKLNSTGGIIWQRRYDGGAEDYMSDIWTTWDGGFIIARTTKSSGNKDIWVLKR